ncbi:MAG: rRNA maturation RNase YbeY [Thermodesulfobacteriota bacterium]
MEINFDNRQTRIDTDSDRFRNLAAAVLEDLACSPATSLSVVVVAADEMAELNLRYRGKEGATNVLSFSQTEGGDPNPQAGLLGDVVICADRAEQDARELGYTTDEMLLYLLIHGILHLVGFTHDAPADADAMASKVDAIFHRLVE